MKSDEVNESTNADGKAGENFYERLPRFVKDLPLEAVDRDLPEIRRSIEYNDRVLALAILPARVSAGSNTTDAPLKSASRYPGRLEELLENALRCLARAGNTNFDERKRVLCCSQDQLLVEIKALDEKMELNSGNIRAAFWTLTGLSYILKHRNKEFYFRPIEQLERAEEEDEIYYRVVFSPVFFSNNLFERFLKE